MGKIINSSQLLLMEVLIRNKLRFFLTITGITFLELIFILGSAFILWQDELLQKLNIDYSFGGILTSLSYFFSLILISLFISIIMLNLDKKSSSLKDYIPIPGNRVLLRYVIFFTVSLLVKVIAIIVFYTISIYIFRFFGAFLVPVFLQIWAILFPCLILAKLDTVAASIKLRIIYRFRSSMAFTYATAGLREYMIEFLKYAFILLLFISWTSIKSNFDIHYNQPAGVLLLFIILFIFNLIMSIIFQIRKGLVCSLELPDCDITHVENPDVTDDIEGNRPKVKSWTKKVLFPLLALFLLVFNFIIALTGLTNTGVLINPRVESVEDKSTFTAIISNIDPSAADTVHAYHSTPAFTINSIFLGNTGTSTDLFNPGALLKSKTSFDESFGRLSEYGNNSTTNTQVDNIDEADIVKTDGKYIYSLAGKKLFITRAYPANSMEIASSIDYTGKNLVPVELMVYKSHIAVILADGEIIRNGANYTGNYSTGNTVINTYNIDHPEKPVPERVLTIKGSYISSRMIQNNIYVITNSKADYGDTDSIYPEYYDSANKNGNNNFDYKNVYYLSGSGEKVTGINYISVFPVDKPSVSSIVKAYAGNADDIYVSEKHIYMIQSGSMAVTTTLSNFLERIDCISEDDYEKNKYGTYIYRVDIQNGGLGDCRTVFVNGRLNNQFSVDEYNGNLRLTVEQVNFKNTSSAVIVFDGNLKETGSLKGLAPGEHIYSSRFIGNRLYLVTFKKVDPLFVIDLKDGKNPKVLGKLKIPGYSEYLHPYDENHIIGFGKNALGGDQNFSWFQGIKMALFDVTDVNNPKQEFTELIGDRGTYSELLDNHKALLYMKNPGLMAFPVSVTQKPQYSTDNVYGDIIFQGAYVYDVSRSEGFKLRGKLSHTFGTSIPADINSSINRILYINGFLYTLSPNCIKATDYKSMKDIKSVSFN